MRYKNNAGATANIKSLNMNKLTILNFTNVYSEETFYKHERTTWIDCSDIAGTDCLCDCDAANAICAKIKDIPPHGIHFIDSGNYHYVSKFFTDKIDTRFVLVVFDHHTDMQPSLFEGLLTCGSWIKDVIDTNKYIEKVVLIGTSDKLLKQVDKTYLPKLVEFKESQLCNKTAWDDFAKLHFNYPIYISIDKDVLDPDVEVTNWDQGATTIQQLKKLLSLLLTHDKLIGIDICGECNYSIKGLLDDNLRKDDTVNRLLLRLCEKEIK